MSHNQRPRTKKASNNVLKFKAEAGGKTYEGTVAVGDGPGPCTLPMMINATAQQPAE